MAGKKPAQKKRKPKNGQHGYQTLPSNELPPLRVPHLPKDKAVPCIYSQPDVLIVHKTPSPKLGFKSQPSVKIRSPSPSQPSSSMKLPPIAGSLPGVHNRDLLALRRSRPDLQANLEADSSLHRIVPPSPMRNPSTLRGPVQPVDMGNTSGLTTSFHPKTQRRQINSDVIRTKEIRNGHRIADLSKPARPKLYLARQEKFSVVKRVITTPSPPPRPPPRRRSPPSNDNSLASQELENYGLFDLTPSSCESNGRDEPLSRRHGHNNGGRLPPMKKR